MEPWSRKLHGNVDFFCFAVLLLLGQRLCGFMILEPRCQVVHLPSLASQVQQSSMQTAQLPCAGYRADSSLQMPTCNRINSATRLSSSSSQIKPMRSRTLSAVKCSAAVEAPPVAAAGRIKLGSSDLQVSGVAVRKAQCVRLLVLSLIIALLRLQNVAWEA